MKSGIYEIVNKINQKRYVGSAVRLSKRKNDHFCSLEKNEHYNRHLQAAYNKYGSEKFEFSIIETIVPEKLIEREQYWIDFYQCCDITKGYNLSPTAGNSLGVNHTEATKNKIRHSRLGSKHSESTKDKISQATRGTNNPFFGKSHTEETKEKIASKKRGTKMSKKTKQKMSDRRKGMKFSEEHKRKIGEANSRRKVSAETRKKMSEARKGKKLSDETRKRMSESKKGEKEANEHKQS